MLDCQRIGQNFLRVPSNKVELFHYLSEGTTSNLELVRYNFYIMRGKKVLHIGPGPDMTEECDHEEADARFIIHVYASFATGSQNHACTDIVVILINRFNRFDSIVNGCELFVSFENGKHNRILNIWLREMSMALGVQRCIALPLWVTITGCDSTSKKKLLNCMALCNCTQ